jgi:hypothetical protein
MDFITYEVCGESERHPVGGIEVDITARFASTRHKLTVFRDILMICLGQPEDIRSSEILQLIL